jgi:hypothetical protein
MTLQSIFAIGSVIGGFAIPAISDVKGRWTAMNYSLLSMLAGNLSIFIGIFYHFYMMIAVG